MIKGKEKGITLIALVVTIVVLLILAGISISMLTGENGVIVQAQDAKIKTRANGAEEVVKLWKSNNYIAGTSEEKVDKETMLQDLKDKKLVYENEIDRINEVIIIKKKDGTIVKEISYGEVIINISKLPETEKSALVILKVESVEGTIIPRLKGEEEINDFVDSISEDRKMEIIKSFYIKLANENDSTANCTTFQDVLELLKNQGEIEEATEEKFWDWLGIQDAEEMNNFVSRILRYEYYNSDTDEVEGYIITNPEGELSDAYMATENGTYTFTIQDAVTGKIYTKDVEVTNVDQSNIYTYNPETGYITGIKEQYLNEKIPEPASIHSQVKIASLQNKYYAKNEFYIYTLKHEIGTSLIIPKEIDGVKITGIDDKAFINLQNLEQIKLHENIISIGNKAFSGCRELKNIILPQNVTNIGEMAFEKCKSLTSIVIPDGITSIEEYTFSECSSLKNITIPDSVTSIGYCAFYSCINLIDIAIPNGITRIEDSTFSMCIGLESITIPDSVTSIGDNAFYYCSFLRIVKIPDGVTSIGDCAFSRCSNLTKIKIPDSVTSIGDSAFSRCSDLTSITIPDNVTTIGNSAFYQCNNLKTINYTGTEEQWNAITIGNYNPILNSVKINYNYSN